MTRTNRILLAVVAVAAAAAAFYFLALAPKRDEIAKLNGDISAKQAEVEQAKQSLVTYEKARAGYKTNYTTLVRLGKAVPSDDDVRSLMVQLQSAAAGTGVDFEKIELASGFAGATASSSTPATPTPGTLASAPGAVPVAGGALSAMPFSFTFNGDYFELQTFLARVEHFVSAHNDRLNATGRLLRLESVAIAPGPAGFPTMQAQIGAAIYVVPPVEGVPGASSPSTQNAGTTPSSPSTPSSTSTTTANAGAAQ
jgi:Tfp pilus assembly protein PilO